jgi:5-methylcytosine-specific restriction protein B
MNPAQISQQAGSFLNRFGPNVLRSLDGEALLQLMHGRQDSDSRCLAYWLEFKDDDEFAGYRFGGIGGGSALKFGIYQRQADNAWMTGPPNAQRVLSLDEAIPMARRQRDELLAGDNVLYGLDVADPSDDAYRRLQAEMEKAAPELSSSSWAHKYWLLAHHDRLDDYHNPRYQRFHLFKLLQTPPDNTGILDGAAPRFVCAGRFVTAARELTVPVTTLTSVLNQRDGGIQRYWRVGTTAGVAGAGESQWSVMRDGHFVSIGWSEQVPDLSAVIGQTNARAQIRGWLIPIYQANPGVATKKASEILNFAQEMAENDVVLACEGQDVLGVGRVRGPYEYDRGLVFPHKRAVQWLLLERWRMGEAEGLLTTVHEIGRSAANLLELERRLFNREPAEPPAPRTPGGDIPATTESLPLLDPFTARVDGILRRKGQVVLYGPPGTGKTYRALGVAKELAARQAFRKSLASLTETEQAEVLGSSNSTEDGPPSGLVRVCTFHPGYGYEDFIEGLRPKTANGQMVFEPQDGIFKRLCSDARGQPDRHFFLVIDEINRGDVPRIFGELITVIELDKRGMRIMLPVAGKSFEVPRNVFLIGTMNTADRSISLLDAALRRRFGFVELMPDSSVLVGRKAGQLSLSAWLDALNNRLRKHLKRDARNLQVGHAYLMPSKPITSVTEFARVLRDDIIPLLEEYCYDDFGTLRNILGDSLVDIENQRIREELFTANKEEALILAVSFEEMQPLLLTQETGSDALGAELPEDTSNDGEDSSHSAS